MHVAVLLSGAAGTLSCLTSLDVQDVVLSQHRSAVAQLSGHQGKAAQAVQLSYDGSCSCQGLAVVQQALDQFSTDARLQASNMQHASAILASGLEADHDLAPANHGGLLHVQC
jgi:hypothetical protein